MDTNNMESLLCVAEIDESDLAPINACDMASQLRRQAGNGTLRELDFGVYRCIDGDVIVDRSADRKIRIRMRFTSY
jgi:hypothetical protein